MNTRPRGFSLLELMTVLIIAGVLLGIGVPAMGDFWRNARITGAANDVMVALHMARSEAIKRRQPVTLCTSAAPQVANPTCAASAQLLGWITFVDTNQSGQRDAGEALLLQHEPLPGAVTGRASANPLRITYLDNGFALNANAAQLVLCDDRGNRASSGQLSSARGILISVTGRAGVSRDRAEIQALVDAIGGPVAGCLVS